MHVTVVLRPGQPGMRDEVHAMAARPLGQRQHLSRTELADRFGASRQDIAQIRRFARTNGLHVVRVNRAARTVEVSGLPARMGRAFGVDLALYRTPFGVVRGRSGPVQVPAWLMPSIQGVFGLDTRRQARPHFRILPGSASGELRPAAGPTASFTPPELARLYDFPANVDGTGQTIALIELGGGFRRSDLRRYFASLGIEPVPRVAAKSVSGVGNQPTGNPRSADGEVDLDIEAAGAVAPGAKIVVYFAPNTTKGFLDAINAAVHDRANDISTISISWGAAESAWTPRAMNAMNAAFQAANLLGISVFCASGDNGSGDGVGDGSAHVDFPASSPFAIGCGGTTMTASGTSITSEVVWNGQGATGGGVSDHFPVPPYQKSIRPTSVNAPGTRRGRGVPDVAAVGDPETGYQVFVDGQAMVFGGTSAVAPLWAGLTALVQQATQRRIAPAHATLYQSPDVFRDVTEGDNGGYAAQAGWDACTGLGTPIGSALLTTLSHTQSPEDTSSPAGAEPGGNTAPAADAPAGESPPEEEPPARSRKATTGAAERRPRKPRKATGRASGR